ncbi:MAG: hypothetical protein JSS32_10765 [Verrucomicrobia bacterium]|nr:hypothetical protein [Verrucomicrobiota bacterium]
MRKKFVLGSLAAAVLILTGDIGYRALPIVKERECYRAIFPVEAFHEKLKEPTPSWMVAQIAADFKPFEQITVEALDETYNSIRTKADCARYRILGNKLYKYVPPGQTLSTRDNPLEMALKTLLLYAKVPDLDFILCPMDGIPEPYMPQDFYLSPKQAPVLGKAKLSDAKYVILIPDQFSLSDAWHKTSNEILSLNRQISWTQKSNKAVWRGTLTDTGYTDDTPADYSTSPRYRLSLLSHLHPDLVDAGIIESGAPENMEGLRRENLLKGSLSKEEHLLAKFQPVMDGHMCTYPGFQWRLLSNSVALKQESNQIQWFYGALEPYKHYLPIQNDMGDLIDKMEWAAAHDEELAEISRQAQEFASKNLLLEDNYKYLYLVLQHYASLQKTAPARSEPDWVCIQYRTRLRLLKTLKLME